MAKGKKDPMTQISRFAIPHDNFKELTQENLPNNVGSVDVVDSEVVLALDNSFLEDTFSGVFGRDIDSVMVRDGKAEVSHSVSSDELTSVTEENLPDIKGSVDVVDSEVVVTLHRSFLEDTFSEEYDRDIDYVLVKDRGAEISHSISGDKLTEMVEERLPNIETSSETFLDISNSVDFRDGEVVVALDDSFLEETVSEEFERDVDSVEVKEEEAEISHSISSSELTGVMEKNIPDIDGSVKVMDGEVVVALDDSFLEDTFSGVFDSDVDSVEVSDEASEINHSVSDDELSSVMDENLPNIEGSVKIMDDDIGLALERSYLKETVAREYGRKVDTIEIEAEEVEVNLSDETFDVEEEVSSEEVEEEEIPSEEVEEEVSSEEVEEEEEFRCEHCGDKFGTEEGLKIHKSRFHEEEGEETQEEIPAEETEVKESGGEEEAGSDIEEQQKERLEYIEDQIGQT